MERRIVRDGGSSELRQLLESWIDVVTEYAERRDWRDTAWWYNERASVGTLAAAAWKCGGIALEEFAGRKTGTERSYPGRVDLFVEMAGMRFVAEAKKDWCSAGGRQPDRMKKRIEEKLAAACRDARASAGLKPDASLFGMVFVVPKIPNTHNVHERLVDWQRRILEIKVDACACFLPEEAESFRSGNGYTYPGCALLMRRADGEAT